MKTLLQNEMSQVSGGNDCYPVGHCYYKTNAAGVVTDGKPSGYSASFCPTLLTTADTTNSIAASTAFAPTLSKADADSKKFQIFFSKAQNGEVELTVGSDICA